VSATASIRQATPSDSAKLKEIIDLSFPSFFRYFASHSVNSDGTVLVSEIGETIFGFVKLTPFSIRGKKYGCILWLAVHPTCRRKGVAAKLVSAGTSRLLSECSKSVFVSVQRRNVASLATFSKEGFRRIGFLGLWRLFGWRVFNFYQKIWFAPGEIVLMR
jgi:ribosomal protein S18 acetylase RimI-like enzyme